jgi:hypothetical protein
MPTSFIGWLGLVADGFGVIGFALTVILLFKSEALRKEMESQRKDYKEEQSSLVTSLTALRANIWLDDLLNRETISQIRTILHVFQIKFELLNGKEDNARLKATFDLLNTDAKNIDKDALCAQLDYFIARFNKKEIE